MKPRWKQLLLAALAASAVFPAMAQDVVPQNPIPNAASLAKANAGDAASQILVGDALADGGGQPRTPRQLAADYKQAADWYRKAAIQGNVTGELRLAALYRDGKGVARDAAEASNWYRKAADQGDAGAQGTLGLLYAFGQGVPRSDVEAYYWLDLAAAVKGPNQEKYAANRQMVGTRITADELAEVQDRVEKWKASHPRP
jgi:TPR repeat protein